MDTLAVTDRNTLAGIARAHARAVEADVRLVVGCRLTIRDSLPVLAYPMDRAGYARLCQLLTLGKGRTGKGSCDIAWDDLGRHGEGLLVILLPDEPNAALGRGVGPYAAGFRRPVPSLAEPAPAAG